MGIFDSIGNIFESEKEKERRIRRENRRIERTVENVIDKFSDRTRDLEKERDALWEKAKQKLQSGQKAEAANILKTYKSKMVMLNRLDRQKVFAQHKLDMITGARDMGEVTGALKDLAVGLNVTPEQLEENLFDVDMVSDDISDINKIMDKAYDKEMDALGKEADREMSATFDDELMTALENEAAGSISASAATASSSSSEQQAINAGLDRLKKLVNEK